MNPNTALWASILLGGCAQVMLRKGVSGEGTKTSARSSRWWLQVIASGWVWAWAVSFVVALALWLVAVSRIDISYAFPLLSAGYVFVALLSRLLLKESIPWQRWSAIAVIAFGVILIARN